MLTGSLAGFAQDFGSKLQKENVSVGGQLVAQHISSPNVLVGNIRPADVSVSGQVIDEKGVELPGVSVGVKDTTWGTITNGAGNYPISVPTGNATLFFGFVGCQKQEIVVGSQTTLTLPAKSLN